MNKLSCTFNYEDWCNRMAAEIEATMRNPATSPDAAFWLIPCEATREGRLVLADEMPAGATEVVRLAPYATWRTMPYSHVQSCVYRACRRMAIIPFDAWPDFAAA